MFEKKLCLSIFLSFLLASASFADTFGTGANSFDIEFVTIGNPGNAPDSIDGVPNLPGIQQFGTVNEVYRIGKHEISEDMVRKANALGNLGITSSNWGPNKPDSDITWHEALRFANWLNTSTGNTPAYKFDLEGKLQLWQPSDPGYDATNLYRNTLAKYFLPSEDEWYKAAYYDPVNNVYYRFPTGSNVLPTSVASGTASGTIVAERPDAWTAGPAEITQAGGLSPYGTMAQGGNAFEWMENDWDLVNDFADVDFEDPVLEFHSNEQVVRGGDVSFWVDVSGSNGRGIFYRDEVHSFFGMRIASRIPEPTTAVIALATLCCAVGGRRLSVLSVKGSRD